MAISAIFFLDIKGRVIIYRDYRGDVSPRYAERFMTKVNELEENSKLTPIIADEGVSYIYLQVSNLYILAVTRTNVNATSIVVFLHRLVEVFKHYFQAGPISPDLWALNTARMRRREFNPCNLITY
jgi:AP-1 complex subunit mu